MEQAAAATPSLLGNRYRLVQTLGTGGMAVVYRAHDTMLERPVAIKILREDFSQTDDFRVRFREEALAAANLTHPNIVTVHDFGYDKNSLYIVMEYVPGTELKTMIKQRGRFTLDEAIPLLVQACAGIGYAHRSGLVHCDVKPQNMLVTPDQRLKVTDFGIARALTTIHPDERYDVVWGSPQYFSPEQASGSPPSPASDVYSLGVILYEMLTGELPFNSNDPSELARMHREVNPVAPRRLNRDIPQPLEQIILKVLSKEPAARYRSADQFGRILVNFSQTADTYAANIPAAMSHPAAPAPAPAAPHPHTPTPSPRPHTVPAAAPERMPAFNPAVVDPVPAAPSAGWDWITIGLGLIAFLSVGGLIPFWLYVWLSLTSMPR